MARFIAFYLPQYHPLEINDKWYGKGYTEWTNISQARPLFKGHHQPNIPADLGFYDLRLKETVKEQIELAKEYGVYGFCYWHYWFEDGLQTMQMPFERHVKDKSLEFPFCIAWANDSWVKKMWNSEANNEVIVEQKYGGVDDYTDHFYNLLEAFKDERYIKIDGKPLVVIYKPLHEELIEFMGVWRRLAQKEGLSGMFFVAHDFSCRDKRKLLEMGYDAIYDDNVLNIHHELSLLKKIILMIQRRVFKRPTVFKYRDAIKYMILEEDSQEDTFPTIAPNWDHSPRSGANAMVLQDPEPKYFKKLLQDTFEVLKNKRPERQIVFIRSWNEWGEGNYLEPDLKYGKGYLQALRDAIDENDN